MLSQYNVTSVMNHESDLVEIFGKIIVDEISIVYVFRLNLFQTGAHIFPTWKFQKTCGFVVFSGTIWGCTGKKWVNQGATAQLLFCSSLWIPCVC